MASDLEKAARRWANVHSTSAKCPCSACEALRAVLPPAPPAVTREEVENVLRPATAAAPRERRICRSWLVLAEENARLRAVAEAAEDLQQKVRSERTRATQESRTWLVPEHCVMAVRAALRRLKEGE